jgi:diadenylate cyclase
MTELIVSIWQNYVVHIVEILILASAIYYSILAVRGTRAIQLVYALVSLGLVFAISYLFHFETIFWILQHFLLLIVLALLITFQPELRIILSRLTGSHFTKILLRDSYSNIREIIEALTRLQKKGYGAIIVFEQSMSLRNYMETGVRIDAEVTADLLSALFMSRAPIHDGAVMVSGGRVAAAGCILPLSHDPSLARILGTRHRAAIGITNVSDAWAIVLSEETGALSIAQQGRLERDLTIEQIEQHCVEVQKQKIEERTYVEKT